MNDFRLRTDVRPSRYELRFDLDLDAWTAKAHGRITLTTERTARELTLHAVDLTITAAAFEGGPTMTAVSYDTEAQTATLSFGADLPAGEHVLDLEWAGEIKESLRGLYRSTRGEERYAATQFEAADARRAFPCFDEPTFKARFALDLVHPSGLTAIANAPVAESREVGDGRTLTRFAETPIISSYLVAFTVGPYESTPPVRTKSGTEVRVWLPPGLAEQGTYAREAHVRSLALLEEYTGIPYPYVKVDAIGIPDFEAGAMENPGAITYRTTLLAADERTASMATFKQVFSVAAHELTHMWWGDLVTMEWWTDLWLNESFASFIGEKVTSAANPDWGYERDMVAQNSGAFNLDSLVSTHAISIEARNVDEANERFDAVTYLKGQGVLRMLETFIGPDTFREGVRIYLNRHRESNASAADFWRALDEASGRDVSRIANAWITEPGHPVVACSVSEPEGGLEVELQQSRFLADPGAEQTAQQWPVPLVIRYGTPQGRREQRVLLDSERTRVRLPGARWYYPNAGGTGFFRTSIDDRSSELLSGGIRELGAEERLALLDNQWALARATRATAGRVVELIAALRGEDDRAVLQSIGDIVGWLGTHATIAETEPAYRLFVDTVFRPQLERLGWDVSPNDTADDREKRPTVISTLGVVAAAQDVRREARRRVDAHLDGAERLHPDVARATLMVAATQGDDELFERYLGRMKEAAQADAQEEARFRSALVDFEHPGVVRRSAEVIFSDAIREQDRSLLILRMLSLRRSREIGWNALKAHWDRDVAVMDPAGKQRCVNAAGQLSPRPLAEDAIAFLTEKQTPDIKETVAQSIERVRILAANAERMAGELEEPLRRIATPA